MVKKPYILFIGNRKKHKNLTLLVKAFARIVHKLQHYLVIAGTKENYIDEVDVLIKELKLSDRVIEFNTPSDDIVISLYQYADLFVFPSLFEGFGLPPLEAVTVGCPVILSDIPVLREVFDNAGYYFNPYSEKDLAEKILFILTNRNIRAKLLKKQKERIKVFDKDKIIDKYIELFDNIIGNKYESSSSWKTMPSE